MPFSLQTGTFHDGPVQIYVACLFIFTKQSCAKLFHLGLHQPKLDDSCSILNTIKSHYEVVWAVLHFPRQRHCFMNGCRDLCCPFGAGSARRSNGITACLFSWTRAMEKWAVRACGWLAVWIHVELKHLWRRGKPHSHRAYAAGYCRNKSRLEPICQQAVVSSRLRTKKLSHARSFFDVQNAFSSQSSHAISAALDTVARPVGRTLWEQRYKEATVRSDGRAEADFRPRSGTMQGDGPSAELFLEPYHP